MSTDPKRDGPDMKKLQGLLKDYADEILKDPPKTRLQGSDEDEELSFGHVVVYHGEEERSTIVETHHVPCYDIGTIRVYHGGYWEPDDYDFECITTAINTYDAMIKVIGLYVELDLQARVESDAQYEMWKEDNEGGETCLST